MTGTEGKVTQEMNTGHGHVFPRPDGFKARCGGPGLCPECANDSMRQRNGATARKRIEETEAVSDPDVYWPMVIYCLRVDRVMAELRHLYTPPEAIRWLASGQGMFGGRVPADLLMTDEGKTEVLAMIERITGGAFS